MLTQLLLTLGRTDDELVPLLSKAHTDAHMSVEWVGVLEADLAAEKHAGQRHVWFGIQPITRPETGRGKASDVTSVVTLYADLDDKNADRLTSKLIIDDLSQILGTQPMAIVVSGGGLQPYWPLATPLDPVSGAMLLMRWRSVVVATAAARGCKVDSQVFNLDRIFRAPGPPNLKPEYGINGAPTNLILLPSAHRVDPANLDLPALDKSGTVSMYSGDGSWLSSSADLPVDRYFTDADAHRYLYVSPGFLARLGQTEQGDGFNVALLQAASDVCKFVPEFYTAEQADEMLEVEIRRIFPGGRDSHDMATIASAARRTTDRFGRVTQEAIDNFNPFALGDSPAERASIETVARAAWEKSGQQAQPVRPTVQQIQKREMAEILGTALVAPESKPLSEAAIAAGFEDSEFLPEWFWSSRPLFGHIRRCAEHALMSPEGVLTAAIAVTLAHVMPNVKLPAPIGSEASLNLMCVLVGKPGDGKSACRKVFTKNVQFIGTDGSTVPPAHRFNPSSGQGISAQYQKLVKLPTVRGTNMGGGTVLERTNWAALAMVEESDTIAGLSSTTGNTLTSELRKAAMGEDLGFANVGDTRTNLPEHSYRFSLLMCMQPELSGWLIGDATGGLPQRFLWCSVMDNRYVEREEQPPWPIRIPIEALPDPMSGKPRPTVVMDYTPEIRTEIRQAAILRKQRNNDGITADLDGHALLTRLKVTGALAILDGRIAMNNDDWHLAGQLIHMSDAARRIAQKGSNDHAVNMASARGRMKAVETAVINDVMDNRTKARVTRSVVRWLGRAGSAGMTKTELRRKLQNDDRHWVDDGILDDLLADGTVRYEDIVKDGVQNGSRWYLRALDQ